VNGWIGDGSQQRREIYGNGGSGSGLGRHQGLLETGVRPPHLARADFRRIHRQVLHFFYSWWEVMAATFSRPPSTRHTTAAAIGLDPASSRLPRTSRLLLHPANTPRPVSGGRHSRPMFSGTCVPVMPASSVSHEDTHSPTIGHAGAALPEDVRRLDAHAPHRGVSIHRSGSLLPHRVAGMAYAAARNWPYARCISLEEVLCRWGGIEEIVTDNGTAFVAALDWLQGRYGITHIASPPITPTPMASLSVSIVPSGTPS